MRDRGAVRWGRKGRRGAIIPIKDTIPTVRRPVATWVLLALNAAVFLYTRLAWDDLELYRWALVPSRFFLRYGEDGGEWLTLVTSTFLHGGWLHLLGNLLYLHVFGDNVEDELGIPRYLFFYLFCGASALFVQAYINPASTLPNIGASGAIAGILGAYVLFFRRSTVIAVIPLFIFFPVVELPSTFFILAWFALQLLSGVGSLGDLASAAGGVAWWAHVGGFAAGVVLGALLRPAKARKWP
jgi:membrane associated rhomboid family serine protease